MVIIWFEAMIIKTTKYIYAISYFHFLEPMMDANANSEYPNITLVPHLYKEQDAVESGNAKC